MDTNLLDQEFVKLANTYAGSSLTLQAMKDWLVASEPVQRLRINPYEISEASSQKVDDIVAAALNGVASGLFDLHWLAHCPHCNMITEEYDNFFELTQTSDCKMCDVAFEIDFVSRVEVTFSLNRAIEDIGMEAFCLPPPILSSKVNIAVPPGEMDVGADVIDEEGAYRFFCPITLAKGLLRVEGDRTDTVQEFKIRQLSSFNFDQVGIQSSEPPRFPSCALCNRLLLRFWCIP